MSDLQHTSSNTSSRSGDYFDDWVTFNTPPSPPFPPFIEGEEEEQLIFQMTLEDPPPPPPPFPIQQPQPILSLSTASLEERYTPEATSKTGGKKPRKRARPYDTIKRRALNKSKYDDPHEGTECEDCGRDLGSPKKLKLCEKEYMRSDFPSPDETNGQYSFEYKSNQTRGGLRGTLTIGCKAMLCAACWVFHELIHVGATIHRHRKRNEGHNVKQRFVKCMPLNQRSPVLFRELVLNRYALKEAKKAMELNVVVESD